MNSIECWQLAVYPAMIKRLASWTEKPNVSSLFLAGHITYSTHLILPVNRFMNFFCVKKWYGNFLNNTIYKEMSALVS